MRDIEKLFARELEIMEARTVHPEYGFTEESMLEHITSPADATVASLLVYGAKHGSCTIGIRPEQPQQRVATAPRSTGLSQYDNIAPREQVATPAQPQQPQQPAYQKPASQINDNPVKPKVSLADDEDPLKPEKPSFGKRIRDMFNKAGNTFIGDGEEGEW
jgi:hypothetical protein